MECYVLTINKPKKSKQGNYGFVLKVGLSKEDQLSKQRGLDLDDRFLIYIKGKGEGFIDRIQQLNVLQVTGSWAPKKGFLDMLFVDGYMVDFKEENIKEYLRFLEVPIDTRKLLLKQDYEDIVKFLNNTYDGDEDIYNSITSEDGWDEIVEKHWQNLKSYNLEILKSKGLTEVAAETIHEAMMAKNEPLETVLKDPFQYFNYQDARVNELDYLTLKKLSNSNLYVDKLNEMKALIVDTLLLQEKGERSLFTVSNGSYTYFKSLQDVVRKRTSKDRFDSFFRKAFVALKDEDEIVLGKLGKEFIVYTRYAFDSEYGIAEKVTELSNSKSKTKYMLDDDVLEKLIKEFEEKELIEFNEEQVLAIKLPFTKRFSIVTGGPGVGKSTITKCINYIAEKNHFDTLMSAPTGKAAYQMRAINKKPAETCHRVYGLDMIHRMSEKEFKEVLIPFDPDSDFQKQVAYIYRNKLKSLGFSKSEREILEFHTESYIDFDSIQIIDEVSMLDIYSFNNILDVVIRNENAHIVVIGDEDQLPSIGAGKILSDLLESDLPSVTLKEIYRQKKDNLILENINKIKNNNINLDFDEESFVYTPTDSSQMAIESIVEEYLNHFDKRNPGRTALLTPYSSRDIGLSTYNLNSLISRRIAALEGLTHKDYIDNYGSYYFEGAMVIKKVNEADGTLVNGDIGVIKQIEKDEQLLIVVNFEDREKEYADYKEFFDDVELAYALTIHKSQGSEYEDVIMVLPKVRRLTKTSFIQKSLVYTGITRAKDKVHIMGSLDTLIGSIQTNNFAIKTRPSNLQSLISQKNKELRA